MIGRGSVSESSTFSIFRCVGKPWIQPRRSLKFCWTRCEKSPFCRFLLYIDAVIWPASRAKSIDAIIYSGSPKSSEAATSGASLEGGSASMSSSEIEIGWPSLDDHILSNRYKVHQIRFPCSLIARSLSWDSDIFRCKPMIIPNRIAEQASTYAKCRRFKEREYNDCSSVSCFAVKISTGVLLAATALQ